MGKLFSHTLEQDCAVVNHCLYACFCGICMHTCLRHNLRVLNDVGEKGGLPFDCLMAFFCGPCSGCQELRSVSVDTWNWWEGFALNPMDSDIKCLRE